MPVRMYKRGRTWYLDINEPNHPRKRFSLKTSDKKIAQLKAAEFTTEFDRKRLGLDYKKEVIDYTSLVDFEQKVTKHIKARYAKRTVETYLDTFEIFIAWLTMHRSYKHINQVRRVDIDEFITFRRQKISARSANNNIQQLKTIFYKGIKLELLQENPVVGIEFLPDDSKPSHHYSDSELSALFNAFPSRFVPHFTTLLYTGLRKGELYHLEWNDIHLSDNYIAITPHGERTKRKMKPRIIPLVDDAIDAIKNRIKLAESDQLVFSNPNGGMLRKNTLYDVLQRAKVNAGITEGNLHSFRHTYATQLLRKGMSIKIVKDLLGHEKIETTEIYSHLNPLEFRDMIAVALNFNIYK